MGPRARLQRLLKAHKTLVGNITPSLQQQSDQKTRTVAEVFSADRELNLLQHLGMDFSYRHNRD